MQHSNVSALHSSKITKQAQNVMKGIHDFKYLKNILKLQHFLISV